MNAINDATIVKEATARLSRLLEEEKRAEKEKVVRDIEITKAKAVIELFSVKSDMPAYQTEVINDAKFEHFFPKDKFEYPASETWMEKIKAFLKFTNRVSTIADMIEVFRPFENREDSKLLNVISNTVNTMLKKGLLKVYKPPVKMKGYYYGNPLWFDGEILKDEYLPNIKEKLSW